MCSLFGVLYFRLEIYLSVSGLGFSILLVRFFFFRVLHVYFRVLSVCFVLRASRKTFSFLHCMILFCICDSGSSTSVFESVFLFWVLVFLFEGFVPLFLGFECLFCITGIKVTEMALMSEE